MRLVAAALLLLHAAAAAALDLTLAVDNIRHPGFAADDIRARVDVDSGGARLDVGALHVAGRTLRKLSLDCREFSMADGDLRCRGGGLKVGAGDTAPLDFHYLAGSKALELTLRDAPVASLVGILPELAAWSPRGKLRGSVRIVGSRIDVDLTVAAAAFANAAGTRAGEGIALRWSAQASEKAGAWLWQTRADWRGGEVYWQPWYARAEGQQVEARGMLDAAALRLDAARLTLPRIGAIEAQGRWERERGTLSTLTVSSDDWQAAPAWAQFGQALLGETPRVAPAGQIRFAFGLDAAGVSSADVELALDRLDVGDGRLALAGLRGRVPWRRDAATRAAITAGGGRAGDLPFGAFTVPLAMDGWNFGFDRVDVPLLDSRLLFENFSARRQGDDWNWQLAAALQPVAMAELTQALRLPRMAGLLSATLPRLSYANRTLSLDGTMIVSVFDGFLAMDGLKVLDPFGRAPRVVADVSARHLDLAMLTHTFSFGNMTGFIDADIHGLEMAGWQPAAFDARVVTSAGSFPKRISRRAVRNISALGGGAAAGAAVEASVVGFFDTFGYERLGLSCRLLAGVCRMGGLEDREHGYLIVQGGGLPALNVMGYNRRVGWDVFVSRLRDVAAGNSKPVFE